MVFVLLKYTNPFPDNRLSMYWHQWQCIGKAHQKGMKENKYHSYMMLKQTGYIMNKAMCDPN